MKWVKCCKVQPPLSSFELRPSKEPKYDPPVDVLNYTIHADFQFLSIKCILFIFGNSPLLLMIQRSFKIVRISLLLLFQMGSTTSYSTLKMTAVMITAERVALGMKAQ